MKKIKGAQGDYEERYVRMRMKQFFSDKKHLTKYFNDYQEVEVTAKEFEALRKELKL